MGHALRKPASAPEPAPLARGTAGAGTVGPREPGGPCGRVLDFEERARSTDLLYASLLHRDERRIGLVALAVALALHVLALLVDFPEMRQALAPRKPTNFIVVKKYVPPPPKVERRPATAPQKVTRRVPIPDPTPNEPEPLREPQPELTQEPLPPDVQVLIGVPVPPPAPEPAGPLLAGVGDVTKPVLIEETKVAPVYPELARLARVSGNVVLQAVIRRDGTVSSVEVLRSTHTKLGFEEAAIEAVKQWRYEPATQNGRPVDVYFTVFVEFTLL